MSDEEELPSFLGVTPFGAYCKTCDQCLAIQRGILQHAKDSHPNEPDFKNATIVREVNRQMKILRNLHAHDLSQFLTDKPSPQPMWFCTACFSAFNKSCNYHRHLETRNSSCVGAYGGKMPCYITICRRFGPRTCNPNTMSAPVSTFTLITQDSSVSMLTDIPSQSSSRSDKGPLSVEHNSKVPAALLMTEQEAISRLEPFVRPDEDAKDLSEIYLPLLSADFEGRMREFLSYSSSQPAEDGILYNWLTAGRTWLDKYAAGHISNVSANVRSRLAEFEQRELDGGIVGSRTFCLRRGIEPLKGELDSILRFFFRYPTTLFDDFKSKSVLNATTEWMIESAVVPKILFTAAAEEPEDHGRLPVACLYGLSRGFNARSGYQLVMNECGWFGSRLSALLHLLRAGVCGYLVTLTGNNSSDILTIQEMEIVSKIQNGRVTNLLAPYVRRLREANARKPRLKTNSVNANLDITSGSFTFPNSLWSTLIPRVVTIAKACFKEIFVDDRWQIFMERPIAMADWVQLEAAAVKDGCQIWIRDLIVKDNTEPLVARLQSIAELCFLGLGTGAVRHEEVLRLKVLSCQWHNSYLYFSTESLKKGSLKATSRPRLVEHRLSLSISRIILLIRYVLIVSCDIESKMLLPSHPDASLLGLVQDIFDFDVRPHMLNVRHLFTSIGNVIMPENGAMGEDGCIVSSLNLTEKSGHTQLTGRRAYGTWLEKSDEILYDHYHSRLGEDVVDPPVVDFTPFSEAILKTSLKELLGRKAAYRSDDQKRMIHLAANSVVRHAFVGLPCGHGKSLSWMVPIMASYLSGRHVGLRIVILPYKFLLGHMVHHATAMFGLLSEKLSVRYLDSSQINKDAFPEILSGSEIPSLLFLNLDAAASLIRFHLSRLQDMARQNLLKRVYLDEFQQLLVEYGFRSSYQCLRELGRIGVPVMCLSGSLPLSIAIALMSYCSLSSTSQGESLDIVKPTDPIGDGFSFEVVAVKDVSHAIIDFVLKSRVGACHILCSSISMVKLVSAELSKTLKVLSITGESGYQEQIRCAKNWLKGDHDILVSTVVGLVGNENRFCRTIIVGGFLFNVSSLVQAIGRLRPTQRGPDSIVKVFHYPLSQVDKTANAGASDALFNEVREAGCLNEEHNDLFKKLFAPIGLQELLSTRRGCYLQQLSGYYGFARLPCSRCTLCLTKCTTTTPMYPQPQPRNDMEVEASTLDTVVAVPLNPYKKRMATSNNNIGPVKKICVASITSNNVASTQEHSEDLSKSSRQLCRKAKCVLSELLYRCMACGTVDCNGELCLKACYRCGARDHHHNSCSFTNEKLGKILVNKGVCFGCYDTCQHTMVKHDMRMCPLKRRLKRLLFLDRDRMGLPFEQYIRQIYASEESFVSTVAFYSKDTMLGRVWVGSRGESVKLDCIQVDLDSPASPLLPPDFINNSSDISCDGTLRSTRYHDVAKARSEYNNLRLEKLSKLRQRKFVFGSLYENIFPGYFQLNPLKFDYDLVVTLPSKKTSMIKVRLVRPEDGFEKKNLLSSIVALGRALSGPGNSRGVRVGDLGSMHAIGLKSSSSTEVFKIDEDRSKKVSTASVVMRDWLEDNLQKELRAVVDTDEQLKVKYPTFMSRGPGSRLIISKNLGNSPHFDNGDTAISIGIWAEDKPGQSENWFFVLPNVSHNGSQGVIIKLAHGVVISWDGRVIYHCTSKTKRGVDNNTYGFMWSSAR